MTVQTHRTISRLLAGLLCPLWLLVFSLPVQAREPARLKVKVIVLTGFEVGDDSGDAPGEFQAWVEREHLDKTLEVKGAPHHLRYNDDGLFASVEHAVGGVQERQGDSPPHMTTVRASELVMAIVLDPRLDVSHAYWLINGIAGIDPLQGSIGSAVWSANVVDGDALRELAPEDMPKGWPYGLFPIGAKAPNTLPPAEADTGGWGGQKLSYTMNYALNPGLAQWAYQLSKSRVTLADSSALKALRAHYIGFPKGQEPPEVRLGATLSSARYWHGPGRTQWARDWVTMWTHGKDRFATTSMEQAPYVGTLYRLSLQGLLDFNRVMMMRSASNYSMPPPGRSAMDTVGDETVGTEPAFEASYRAGSVVVDELLKHWDQYEATIPTEKPE